MNGPSITSAAHSASTFGTNASVASLICVTAWTNATSRPTTNATSSGGPAQLQHHQHAVAQQQGNVAHHSWAIASAAQIGILMMS